MLRMLSARLPPSLTIPVARCGLVWISVKSPLHRKLMSWCEWSMMRAVERLVAITSDPENGPESILPSGGSTPNGSPGSGSMKPLVMPQRGPTITTTTPRSTRDQSIPG